MSDSIIHPHNEITGLVPVNHHQHDESRKFQKRKKREKDDNAHPDIPEEAVEDLLHHEDEDETDQTPLAELPKNEDGQDHLDLLL